MRGFILLILTAALLSACGGDGGSSGSGSPVVPVKNDTPVPPEPSGPPEPPVSPVHPGPPEPPVPPPKPQPPDNRLSLTKQDIRDIGRNLEEVVYQDEWSQWSESEKRTLLGAWLVQATGSIKPLNWTQLNDEDLNYLVNLYFDENLLLKRKGN